MGVEERYKKRKESEKTNTLYNGVENRYLSKNIETVGKEISNRVNTWLANNNNYFSNAQSRFSGKSTKYRSDASDWLTTVTTQRENFQKEAESIKATLSQYKDFFGEEYVNSVYKALDGNLKAQEDIINASSKDLEYWSQWESEDEYNTAYRMYGYQQKYTGKGYNDIITALNGLADGEEKEWLNSNKYGLLKNAADFADNSKYVSTYRGGEKFNYLSGMYTDTGYDDIMYDYINRDEKAINRQLVADVQTNAALLGLDKSERGEMTDDEIAIFNYLYATQGSDVAYEYIDYLTSDLNARQRETQEAKWAEYAKKSPVASSVFSVIESPLKGLSYIGQLTDYIDDGKIDQNAGYNKFSYINSAIRDEVTKTVEANWGGVGSFAYQTGMSMGDFLFSTAVSGGNSAISLAIMGTGAAADTVIASKDMGLSDNQAFLLGTAAGAIEVATEKIGIDALFDMKALKGSAGKYILQNFLAEGAEEGLSNIGNTIVEVVDLILSGDESKIKREIYAIMQEQNIDEGAAFGKYALGKLQELGLDVLGGAISGGIMGGGGAVIGAIGNTIQGAEMQKNYGAEIGSALTTEALEINPNNSFAQKMQTKLDGGKNLSNRQIGKLVQQNETAMYENDVTAIQSAAESRLMELGEKGDVKAIAAALTKQAQGERLTFTERERIKSSTYGQRVANELNTDNIKSGAYSSSWAERIGTDRINAEEYGRLIQEMEADTAAEPAKVEAPAKVIKEAKTAEVTPLAEDVTEIDNVAAQDNVTETKAETVTENTSVKENAVESKISASDEVVDTEGETVTLESASQKYGAQAGAMISTYTDGQDVAKFDAAYQAAYDMGKSGVNLSYAMQSEATAYLTESQRELAHAAGADASTATAKAQDEANKAKANGKTGRRKGVVKGEGVSISDLKSTFNDTQNTAYKLLSTYAEATGIDIVLFKSEANADGKFEGAQGKFKWSEDTIYIDINAGLADINSVDDLAKYTMLRTFSHEFCHFIEKWNPIWYNEFRRVVFDTITERGENVADLIETKQAQSEGMTYDEASREVVAEAMTDILPDANFVEELATNHKNIFEQLLAKLKEFVADLKAYFNSIGHNPSREANALKEQIGESVKYVESIVKLFDKVAVGAVDNYQMTVAFEEKAENTVTTEAINADENADTVSETANTKAYEHFSVTDDTDNRVTTIKFDGKPSNAAREILRNNAFIWNKTKGEWFRSGKWYGKSLIEDVIYELNATYAEENTVAKGETQPTVTKTAETVTESENSVVEQTNEVVSEADNRAIEEREKAYKKKFSSWLKKAGRQYVLHYGGAKFLSDGAFGMRATDDEIGWARLEFSGMITETDLPKQTADVLDNATTLVTEAPLEGGLGIDSVFVFNVDGKNQVYNKKLLSKLDGNLFYMGNFMKGFKVLKAVDAEGNVVGFLLPMKPGNITNTKPSKLKSFSDKFLSQLNQEAKQNGTENADNNGTVRQPDTDRQGDTPVLEGLQAEDVQRDVRERDSVGDTIERGQETVRDDNRSDAAGTRRGSGEGNSEVGDLRRNDGLTPEASEKLHEEATEQIAQQSTEQPKGRNFVIGDSLDLPSGEKSRYKANVEAIRLVKQLEAEGRYATEAEQAILSKYVGWGGLANAFDQRKPEWAKEYTELKELLSDEEYTSARGSTLNAHYTDISVIKAMYDGLAKLGFNGGRMLEPSSGVGNFVGAMPTAMSEKVKSWTMVELDSITGLMAKYLYPNADVRIQGFEKANIPDNYMDVAISNVPFGNYAIADKTYPKKVTDAIHNYFFAKSLDKVRPGGIVMFITSSYTMNSKDSTVRRYIMQRADLLGAIRLPDTAFKVNAGTEVVTDILVLKKRAANTTYSGENFLESNYKYINGYNGAYINGYFDAHPEMVLGTPSMEGGMYRSGALTYKALEGKGSLADQIREAFSHIEGKMEYPATLSREKTNFAVERASKGTKKDGYVAKGDKIYQNKDGELVEKSVSAKEAERIKGMLEIRDAARELMTYQQQGLKDSEIKKARTKLNKIYDDFVKKNGYLNSPANKNAFKEDPDCFSLYALENYDPDKKTATKADIFSKNTIAPNRTVTSAKDVAEGLIVSVNQTGGVDTALIARLTGKTEADVVRELIDSRKAFKNRNGDLETAETYLSGNVRAKLRDAEALVPLDSDYNNNVEALKSVIPEDVGYQDIFVNPGTPWIPNSVYSDFAAYMLGGRNSEFRQDVDITRNRDTGNFTVELNNRYLKVNAANTQKWGTSRRTFLELFDAMLNSKSVVIKDKLDDGSFVVNKDATAAANEKIENIQKEFQDWLWRDEARRAELATLYNEVFNSIVTPKYNGDNLTVNGANAMKPLRPHQRNAVQRVISSGGNTLLAHRVGAGKTYEMAAAAMKLKELGLVKKPMFAVPKSLVAQWGNEFVDFFPTAKLLVAEASDFTAANRKVFMNRIATGEYDAVIVSYEQFEKLPMSDDFTRQLYQEQIDSVIAAIEEAKAEKGAKSLSIKDLEKKRKSLQTKIEKLTDKAKDEGNIDFEQLGVDSLFVDEAHNFKNLFYTTSMTNVAGLGNKDGSKRAFDLYTKVRYLQQLNGGRGIVFATATPVMNSMSEMYIMQKYLQPDLLNQLGLSTFDSWAKQFGEVVNGVEIKPSGQGYRVKQSFSRFKNMSELQLLFRNFADVLTDVPGLKIPTMKGGKVNVVVCEPGQFQQDFMKELEKRADNIKNVDPSEDNMLKITSDGRKISYTQRMIDPSLPYEEGCKIYRCADNVIKEYNDSKSIKGTQLIFCDMATPKGSSNNNATATEDIETDMESAQLYDDLKTRLRQGGIPAKEIAFIHEADTDAKKKKLFEDVNEGKVRVLIGSTGKMGVGMNAQKRIVAIHHLDAPWRPGDVEQRDGRAFRQKNMNDEVSKYTYVTEGSFDARLWDILERKQNFINQVMNGENVGRETEDTGEVTLSAAEVKALASGSPLIMEQVELDTAIKKLESLYRAHISAVRSAKERLSRDKGEIAKLEKQIANGKTDIANRTDTYSDEKFSINVGKTKFTDKKDAGTALMAEATAKATADGYTTIGRFAGFDLRVIKTSEGINGLLVGKQGYPFKTYSNNTTFMITQLVGVVESIDEKIKLWQHNLTEVQQDIAEQEKLIAEPFAKQAELDEKRKRYNEVMEILNPKEEQSLDSVAEDTVQEQSREYLGDGDDFAEGITSGRRVAGTNYNLSVRDYSLREITTLYAQHVLEPEYDAIFDRVFAFCEDAKISYSVVPVIYNNEGKKVPGKSRGDKILLSADYFNRSDISDQEKSQLILHEMLHTATTYAMNAYESATKKGATADLPKNIYNSCKQIDKVYDAIKNNPRFEKQYGIKNAREMIAELSNPEFVDRLKSSYPSAWHHLLSAICEIFGINKSFTNYDKLTKAVDEILTHPDYQLAKDYYSFVKGNTHYLDESQYADVQEQSRAYLGEEQEQQRTNTLTDREILALAADAIKVTDLTEAERGALDIFKKRLAKLESLQDERAEQGRLYKEQQFGANVDRAKAAETLNRMHVLDDQIKTASADVLSIEDKQVLSNVLKKARKVVENDQRTHDAEILKRYRDRTRNAAAIKKYRERIQKDVNDLYSWITKPNNKDITKHVPDVLKNSVIPFLASIDFTSKQQLRGDDATKADTEFAERLKKLQNALREEISVDDLYSGYIDLPANFMSVLNDLVKSVDTLVKAKSGEFVINKMTSEELKDLSSVIRILKTSITKINQFHANAMYSHVWEAGDNSIDALSVMASDNGKANAASNFVFWQQIRPAFAFERFGEGGKAIYDGLRRGQAQLAFNTQKIVEFTDKAYTDKEVKAWEKEIKTIRITAGTIKMRVSDIMSFYELSKQPDSLRHMLGEGMRVATYTLDGKKISDNGHILTELDIATIINELSQRQKDVADAMQKFMQEQGGAWGNYVSVARFGEELFTNDHYFPINSDGRHLQSTADEHPSNASLYALLNMSFTKARNEKANNRIVVYSIFDVFANHMASMAQYNAMALPVLDAIKWFNYQQKTEDHEGNRYVKDSVREQMDRVYGVPEETRPGKGNSGYAQSFVLNILKAFNGTEAQGTPTDAIGMNALRHYNMAQIAYNFRVVVQQPLAITRAALLVDYGSIMRGMKLNPAAIKQNVEEMRKYSGIAAWKSLGFYDVNISRGLTDTIKHSSTVMQNIGEFGMKGAEYADTLTWAAMWSACKEQVIKKQKLTPKDAGFYEAVTKLFEDVIYKTQVVDSILTKNEFLRSKGLFARAVGSFMSEPVAAASMLIDAVDKYNADMKRGMNRQQAWEKNKRIIGRTMYVYAVSAAILAAVQAVADAFRDDDDYEEWYEKWLEAFGGNLVDEVMPFNKLPILSDFYDLGKELLSIFGVDTYGNPPQSVFMQWYDSLVKGTQIIYDKIAGEDTNYTWYGGIYRLLQAVSGMSGLPMASTTREIVTVWNNIVGAMAPSLKVKSYDPGEQNDIKYAYQDGYLTDEEAIELLLEKGLVDNEDEAYFTVSGWEAGDGYSRFGSLDTALRSGVGFEEAMNELISHGYTEDDIHSRVRTKASEWYKGGEISRAQAESMLEKYTDMTSDEITEIVNKWSAVVVTGIEYDDIGDEFMSGNITAERAVEMYMRYGNMTSEKATDKVAVLSFVKEHPECEGITAAAVAKYTEYCEPQGIDAKIFYDVWKFKNEATTDRDERGEIILAEKDKVLNYIDSLDLSRKQKDAIYYAFGWAKSTIKDAPWR